MNKNILLGHFVYRVLVRRIFIAAIAIALVLVLAISFIERRSNYAEFQQLTLNGADIINQSLIQYLDNGNFDSIQSVLNHFSVANVRRPDGHFVYYEIYDQKTQVVARIIDDDYRNIDLVLSTLKDISRSTDSQRLPVFKEFELNQTAHVGIVLPLYDSADEVRAFMLGIYAVSEHSVAKLESKMRRNLVLVFCIVLLTSALLYPVILRLTKTLATFSTSLLNANLDMLETLGSAIAKRDSDTNSHNYRVTIISVRLAEKLGLDSMAIKGIIKGSFLHDVGKIGIRDHILLKPGKLDDDEFEIMKTHVDHGIEIVCNSSWLSDAVDVVSSHHEKFDGSGYPEGKSQEGIPVSARIFAIADVFDALTSKRPYKKPFSFEKTMDIMRDSKGSHFDPELLQAFELIAEGLYQHLSDREDEVLRQEIVEMTQQYFSSGIDALKY
ncbi:MAG: HD-GYP domain-containing protein [Gammaproteobacteria bacterium]|nr:HD-GYP domain-containing protein [Gammaproteobacteria bacterium]